jgi:hypothetical protein
MRAAPHGVMQKREKSRKYGTCDFDDKRAVPMNNAERSRSFSNE